MPDSNITKKALAMAMKEKCVSCLADMKKIDWNSVKPANNPTIARMLTVSTGVFTALDMGEAIATQKYWVSINYVGVGRFAVAIGSDVSWGLKVRNVKKVRDVYENIRQQTFRKADVDIYKRIGTDMDIQMDKLGLSLEQTEILYNLEYYKTLNDIERTNIPITREGVKELKTTWLQDWNGRSLSLMVLRALRRFLERKCIGTLWMNCNSALPDKILMNRGID